MTQLWSPDFHLRAENLCSALFSLAELSVRQDEGELPPYQTDTDVLVLIPIAAFLHSGADANLWAGQNPRLFLAGVDTRMGSLCPASAEIVMTVDYYVAWGNCHWSC